MIRKVISQIEAFFFNHIKTIFILYFHATSRTVCKTNRIHASAAMIVLLFYIKNALAATLDSQMFTEQDMTRIVPSFKIVEPTMQRKGPWFRLNPRLKTVSLKVCGRLSNWRNKLPQFMPNTAGLCNAIIIRRTFICKDIENCRSIQLGVIFYLEGRPLHPLQLTRVLSSAFICGSNQYRF